ncbi:helix-turn-helix domain-containing protein [Sphingomonas sp. QA11]|uniref:AraC family transcriptional regulator n=1 Tax=Sphingomonas sp. QA11 TaxID=2950605 RepID=UPI00234B9FA0|nr:AraC family transcriptional regulator [Sphingomonas sp. QA11]WCM25392.1 helix-turn-helix domain-containing protein [Sphingomonas sp. QA11]
MDYAEQPLPPELDRLVAAIWTIAANGHRDDWIEQDATPDGCIELIRRTEGRSVWGEEQPPLFATGLNLAPVRFRMSGDARFIGIRLWPWAWAMLSGLPCPDFAGRWIAIDHDRVPGSLLADPDKIVSRLIQALAGTEPHPIATHILAAISVADIARASGRTHRTVQRWFEREVGLPPRSYLRLIRFRRTMADLAGPTDSLADQAARHGFADQSHMARDFRLLARTAPRTARATAKGPFLAGKD